ncbi:MAG TPA: MBL fold metallo-hydrolase RNA specificity domain-containing protein, partial [Candidatus Hydrogenedentes bacterium]|nr:MBL fold metallo-hydrolase RNA specificity domain-containing protein [Candidatus Hydrogenedentota bacterium]
ELVDWPHFFEVGVFTVTPHLVDHSSFGAFAFEIAAEGRRLFYSGDFREHGFLGKAMDILYAKIAPGVDALLMEGTMLGRAEGRVQTEEELSQEATELCKGTDKAVLVYQSGQNVTRAVAFYKAAVRSGRWFVPDVYMADVLFGLGECPGGGSLPWPGKPGFDKARVWYPRRLTTSLFNKGRKDIPYQFTRAKLKREEMTAHPEKVMLFVRPGMEDDIARIPGLHGGTLLYSLWEGYRDSDRTAAFLKAMEALGITVKDLHTSGHADIPSLQRMTEKLQPKKILPIHTLHRRDYAGLFNFPVEITKDDRYTL